MAVPNIMSLTTGNKKCYDFLMKFGQNSLIPKVQGETYVKTATNHPKLVFRRLKRMTTKLFNQNSGTSLNAK